MEAADTIALRAFHAYRYTCVLLLVGRLRGAHRLTAEPFVELSWPQKSFSNKLLGRILIGDEDMTKFRANGRTNDRDLLTAARGQHQLGHAP